MLHDTECFSSSVGVQFIAVGVYTQFPFQYSVFPYNFITGRWDWCSQSWLLEYWLPPAEQRHHKFNIVTLNLIYSNSLCVPIVRNVPVYRNNKTQIDVFNPVNTARLLEHWLRPAEQPRHKISTITYSETCCNSVPIPFVTKCVGYQNSNILILVLLFPYMIPETCVSVK